jgi:hypothetical protein
MGDPPIRKPSVSISNMMINWINFFDQKYSIKTMKDLANGNIFIDLIQLIVAKNECRQEFDQLKNQNKSMRYDTIQFIFNGK